MQVQLCFHRNQGQFSNPLVTSHKYERVIKRVLISFLANLRPGHTLYYTRRHNIVGHLQAFPPIWIVGCYQVNFSLKHRTLQTINVENSRMLLLNNMIYVLTTYSRAGMNCVSPGVRLLRSKGQSIIYFTRQFKLDFGRKDKVA